MGDYTRAGELLARSVEQMHTLGNTTEEATAAGYAGVPPRGAGRLRPGPRVRRPRSRPAQRSRTRSCGRRVQLPGGGPLPPGPGAEPSPIATRRGVWPKGRRPVPHLPAAVLRRPGLRHDRRPRAGRASCSRTASPSPSSSGRRRSSPGDRACSRRACSRWASHGRCRHCARKRSASPRTLATGSPMPSPTGPWRRRWPGTRRTSAEAGGRARRHPHPARARLPAGAGAQLCHLCPLAAASGPGG